MYHREPLCQEILLLFRIFLFSFLLQSCGVTQKKDNQWMSEYAQSQWITGQYHPILDPEYFFDNEDHTIPFSITNRVGDAYLKAFVFSSAKIEKLIKLCSPNPFTIGVIPRIIVKNSGPAQIIVFGRESFYKNFKENATHLVRLIGGLELNKCKDKYCNKIMLLMAIDPQDKKYKKVFHREDLEKIIDWNKMKKYIESAWGINLYQHIPAQAIFIKRELSYDQLVEEILIKKNILDNKKLEKIKKICTHNGSKWCHNFIPSKIHNSHKWDIYPRCLLDEGITEEINLHLKNTAH